MRNPNHSTCSACVIFRILHCFFLVLWRAAGVEQNPVWQRPDFVKLIFEILRPDLFGILKGTFVWHLNYKQQDRNQF